MEIYRRFSFDKSLFLITLLLLVIGIVMVFSSSAVLAGVKYRQPLYYLAQHLMGAVAGIVLAAVIMSVRKPFFRAPAAVYGLLLFSAFLLMLCFVMPSIAKTNRWIQLFGIRFQPSELAKISLILFFAYYCEAKKDKLNEWKTLLLPLGVLFLFFILILKEPNFSTAFFIAGLSAMVLFMGGVKLRYFAGWEASSPFSLPSTSSRPITGWTGSRASFSPTRIPWERVSRSTSPSWQSARAVFSG